MVPNSSSSDEGEARKPKKAKPSKTEARTLAWDAKASKSGYSSSRAAITAQHSQVLPIVSDLFLSGAVVPPAAGDSHEQALGLVREAAEYADVAQDDADFTDPMPPRGGSRVLECTRRLEAMLKKIGDRDAFGKMLRDYADIRSKRNKPFSAAEIGGFLIINEATDRHLPLSAGTLYFFAVCLQSKTDFCFSFFRKRCSV